MGWCGGTEYFDGAMNLFIDYVPKEMREPLMYSWYRFIRDGDWDCVEESEYWSELREILKKNEPEYWEDEHDS